MNIASLKGTDEVKRLFSSKRRKVGVIKEQTEKARSAKEEHHKLHGWHDQRHEALHGTKKKEKAKAKEKKEKEKENVEEKKKKKKKL